MENIKSYNRDGSDMRRAQLKMLEILQYIDGICKKNNIEYWLAAGTLLGAVRHGGFIPWDDDLDIEMRRKDYLKLLRILKKELPKTLELQVNSTDINYVAPYAKVRDRYSFITENNNIDINYKYRGVYIDLFPLESVSDWLLKFSNFIHYYFLYKISRYRNDKLGIKVSFVSFMFLFINLMYKIFRFFDRIVSRKYLNFTYGADLFCKHDKKGIFPLKNIVFEGKNFPSPCNVDLYLSECYGDYLKIPKESDRHSHIEMFQFLD